jgi:hypothetical protein
VLLYTPGCHAVLPLEQPGPDDAKPDLQLVDARSDRLDLVVEPDLVVPPCAEKPDQYTVALYTFDGSSSKVLDLSGDNHHGTLTGENIGRAPGMPGCGQALENNGSSSPISYVEIPNSSDFELTQGTVDFWVWTDPGFVAPNKQAAGLVSRDSGGNGDGHLTVFWTAKDEIVFRLQSSSKEAGRCSRPKARGVWHHVEASFGDGKDFELVVTTGGVSETVTPRPQIIHGGFEFPCDGSLTSGIDGNTNPWVLGASSNHNTAGRLDKVSRPFTGLIDSVRISDVRR